MDKRAHQQRPRSDKLLWLVSTNTVTVLCLSVFILTAIITWTQVDHNRTAAGIPFSNIPSVNTLACCTQDFIEYGQKRLLVQWEHGVVLGGVLCTIVSIAVAAFSRGWQVKGGFTFPALTIMAETVVFYALLHGGVTAVQCAATLGQGVPRPEVPLRYVWWAVTILQGESALYTLVGETPLLYRFLALLATACSSGCLYAAAVLSLAQQEQGGSIALMVLAMLLDMPLLIIRVHMLRCISRWPFQRSAVRRSLQFAIPTHTLLIFGMRPLIWFCTFFGKLSVEQSLLAYCAAEVVGKSVMANLLSWSDLPQHMDTLNLQLLDAEAHRVGSQAKEAAMRSIVRYLFHELRVPLNSIVLGLTESQEALDDLLEIVQGPEQHMATSSNRTLAGGMEDRAATPAEQETEMRTARIGMRVDSLPTPTVPLSLPAAPSNGVAVSLGDNTPDTSSRGEGRVSASDDPGPGSSASSSSAAWGPVPVVVVRPLPLGQTGVVGISRNVSASSILTGLSATSPAPVTTPVSLLSPSRQSVMSSGARGRRPSGEDAAPKLLPGVLHAVGGTGLDVARTWTLGGTSNTALPSTTPMSPSAKAIAQMGGAQSPWATRPPPPIKASPVLASQGVGADTSTTTSTGVSASALVNTPAVGNIGAGDRQGSAPTLLLLEGTPGMPTPGMAVDGSPEEMATGIAGTPTGGKEEQAEGGPEGVSSAWMREEMMLSIKDTAYILRMCHTSALGLGRLLDDFLSLDKIEQGQLQVELGTVQVKRMVDETLRLFQPAVESKQLRIKRVAHRRVPATIVGDDHKLRQCLANFVSNAIKFSPQQGQVTVHVAVVYAPPRRDFDGGSRDSVLTAGSSYVQRGGADAAGNVVSSFLLPQPASSTSGRRVSSSGRRVSLSQRRESLTAHRNSNGSVKSTSARRESLTAHRNSNDSVRSNSQRRESLSGQRTSNDSVRSATGRPTTAVGSATTPVSTTTTSTPAPAGMGQGQGQGTPARHNSVSRNPSMLLAYRNSQGSMRSVEGKGSVASGGRCDSGGGSIAPLPGLTTASAPPGHQQAPAAGAHAAGRGGGIAMLRAGARSASMSDVLRNEQGGGGGHAATGGAPGHGAASAKTEAVVGDAAQGSATPKKRPPLPAHALAVRSKSSSSLLPAGPSAVGLTGLPVRSASGLDMRAQGGGLTSFSPLTTPREADEGEEKLEGDTVRGVKLPPASKGAPPTFLRSLWGQAQSAVAAVAGAVGIGTGWTRRGLSPASSVGSAATGHTPSTGGGAAQPFSSSSGRSSLRTRASSSFGRGGIPFNSGRETPPILSVDPRPGTVAYLKVSVEDQGVGISPADQAKLFQPFQQVKAGALQKGNGTGLGLAIVRQIVQLSGGFVSVESAEGKGSTFSFCVPVDPPRRNFQDSVYGASPPTPSQPPAGQGGGAGSTAGVESKAMLRGIASVRIPTTGALTRQASAKGSALSGFFVSGGLGARKPSAAGGLAIARTSSGYVPPPTDTGRTGSAGAGAGTAAQVSLSEPSAAVEGGHAAPLPGTGTGTGAGAISSGSKESNVASAGQLPLPVQADSSVAVDAYVEGSFGSGSGSWSSSVMDRGRGSPRHSGTATTAMLAALKEGTPQARRASLPAPVIALVVDTCAPTTASTASSSSSSSGTGRAGGAGAGVGTGQGEHARGGHESVVGVVGSRASEISGRDREASGEAVLDTLSSATSTAPQQTVVVDLPGQWSSADEPPRSAAGVPALTVLGYAPLREVGRVQVEVLQTIASVGESTPTHASSRSREMGRSGSKEVREGSSSAFSPRGGGSVVALLGHPISVTVVTEAGQGGALLGHPLSPPLSTTHHNQASALAAIGGSDAAGVRKESARTSDPVSSPATIIPLRTSSSRATLTLAGAQATLDGQGHAPSHASRSNSGAGGPGGEAARSRSQSSPRGPIAPTSSSTSVRSVRAGGQGSEGVSGASVVKDTAAVGMGGGEAAGGGGTGMSPRGPSHHSSSRRIFPSSSPLLSPSMLGASPRLRAVGSATPTPRVDAAYGRSTPPPSRSSLLHSPMPVPVPTAGEQLTRAVVVDDIASNRQLLVRMLKRRGLLECYEAADGTEVLAIADQLAAQGKLHTIQAWFLDEEMPIMNGSKAISELRGSKYSVCAVMLSVTGNALAEDQTALLKAGSSAVVSKPVQVEALETILNRYGLKLNKRRGSITQ